LVPTAAFGAIFVHTLSSNFMLTNRSYSFGPQAVLVLGKSLHRLLWPWFYIIILLAWVRTRRPPSVSQIGMYLGLVIVTMTPYMFIAYRRVCPAVSFILRAALMTMLPSAQTAAGTQFLNIVVSVHWLVSAT
jgi:hypothetical protein